MTLDERSRLNSLLDEILVHGYVPATRPGGGQHDLQTYSPPPDRREYWAARHKRRTKLH
jgi:hypothetical protein